MNKINTLRSFCGAILTFFCFSSIAHGQLIVHFSSVYSTISSSIPADGYVDLYDSDDDDDDLPDYVAVFDGALILLNTGSNPVDVFNASLGVIEKDVLGTSDSVTTLSDSIDIRFPIRIGAGGYGSVPLKSSKVSAATLNSLCYFRDCDDVITINTEIKAAIELGDWEVNPSVSIDQRINIGRALEAGDLEFAAGGANWDAETVPQPTTLTLMLVGLVGLGLNWRQKAFRRLGAS